MLWAANLGGLELRSEGGETRLSGRFPYGQETVLREGGDGLPELREVFAPRAFGERLQSRTRDIHLLAQHHFDQPLASVRAGTLTLTETEAGLSIEARVDTSLAGVTYVSDLLAGIRAGLIPGLSPGFRLVPGQASETIERKGDAVLRTIRAAHLEEISIVTRPAYPTAQIEARNWNPEAIKQVAPAHSSNRWR